MTHATNGPVKALGYMTFNVSDLVAWRTFATEVLGIQAVDREDGAIDLRIDDYSWRIRLVPGGNDDIGVAGWEVADADALSALQTRLEKAGITATAGSAEEAADRRVEALIKFNDCDGLPCEAFFGPLQKTNDPYLSPLGVTFKTADQGLGHIVLITPDREASEAWYKDVLGFRVSDYVHSVLPGGFKLSFTFMHCNPRHHSVAFCSLPMPKRLQHFMLEVSNMDEVGRSIYRAQERNIHVSLSLGRHSNDEMLSIYYNTPSGFDVEYGYGALSIDDSWHVKSHDAPSAWGHKFAPPPARS